MFEQFVTRPKHLQLHREGPMREERERYLRHLAEEGRAPVTLEHTAGYILHAALLLNLQPGETVSEKRLRMLGQKWHDSDLHGGPHRRKPSAITVHMFVGRAKHWLAFCGRMDRPQVRRPFDDLLRSFLEFEHAERGWSPTTIGIYRRDLGMFLSWTARRVGKDLRKLDARKLTTYAQEPQFTRWSRCSIASHICHVRVFLRWLGARQGCD
jgi:hypothetical protein